MAQNITLLGANYPDVPAVQLPITGGGTATFSDTRSVTYNLSGGATASVTPSEAVTGQGFSVKLTAPTGYVLSGVTVTMGGTDITSQVFTPDEAGGGGGTSAISVVDTTDSHGGTVREITALDISDTTAVASDVTQGKYFYTAQGVKTAGTGSGGSPSATQHTIYFEFSDSTNTTITAYYDDSFISNAITATEPTTYGGKTVTLAQLDGVTWYEVSSGIPLNTELIDYTKSSSSTEIDDYGRAISADPWYYASDYTAIDPSMTFSFTGTQWGNLALYDANKTFVRAYSMNDIADSTGNNIAHGTLSGNRISGSYFVRISAQGNNSTYLSLIRTA